MLTTARNKKIK